MYLTQLRNQSFPPGKWFIEYNKDKDRYIIKTEYGDFIAEVGPTLVAHWLVEVFNAITN